MKVEVSSRSDDRCLSGRYADDDERSVSHQLCYVVPLCLRIVSQTSFSPLNNASRSFAFRNYSTFSVFLNNLIIVLKLVRHQTRSHQLITLNVSLQSCRKMAAIE